MANSVSVKTYADSYLYGIGGYEKKWMDFFIKSEIIDKNSELFKTMEYDIKRMQHTEVLLKTLQSNNVILLRGQQGLPRSFKVFAAKDIKHGDNAMRVFIDVTDILVPGKDKLKDRVSIDILTSNLMAALANLIYYAAPARIVNHSKLLEHGTECFSSLFTHVIDYLRIGGVDRLREKIMYLSALYYQMSVLKIPYSDTIERRAKKVSGLGDRDIQMISMQLSDNCFDNINTFINDIAKVIKADGLKLDNFIEKWMFLYHSGTQFATELYPAFSTMITNAYGGAYLNNQKLIEKICGKSMVEYTATLLRLGSELK